MAMNRKKVVVLGGGYGGVKVSKELDKDFDVTLIEKKDLFFHNIAALRALVDPSVVDKVFVPYDKLLKKGKVVHGEVVDFDDKEVTLANEEKITFDYLVVALGTTNNSPSKINKGSSEAKAEIRETYQKLKDAKKVLVIGGGSVGVELASEVATEFPNKEITLVHSEKELIPGPLPEKFRAKVVHKLTNELGVKLILGEKVILDGTDENTKTFKTEKGTELEADIRFLTIGNRIANEPVKKHFSANLDESGFVNVNSFFQLEGHKNIFVIGDLANTGEVKLGFIAGRHSSAVATNIKLLEAKKSLKPYTPFKPVMFLAMGRRNGVGLMPNGMVVGGTVLKLLKSKEMFIGRNWTEMNQKAPK